MRYQLLGLNELNSKPDWTGNRSLQSNFTTFMDFRRRGLVRIFCQCSLEPGETLSTCILISPKTFLTFYKRYKNCMTWFKILSIHQSFQSRTDRIGIGFLKKIKFSIIKLSSALCCLTHISMHTVSTLIRGSLKKPSDQG